MHQDASAPDRGHYFWIDALRGGAAIIVLISHVSIFGLYGYEHTLAKWPPTRLLWSGHQAVILFFVISGFALYLLFEQMAAARGRWLKFITVRFLRLYPPYLASLLLALLVLKPPALFGVATPPNAPVIVNGHLTIGTLIGHLLMIGQFGGARSRLSAGRTYPLYHSANCVAAVLLFYGKCPAPLMWVISIAASVGLAWVFYLAIERPSKAASRAVRSQAIVSSAAPPAP